MTSRKTQPVKGKKRYFLYNYRKHSGANRECGPPSFKGSVPADFTEEVGHTGAELGDEWCSTGHGGGMVVHSKGSNL